MNKLVSVHVNRCGHTNHHSDSVPFVVKFGARFVTQREPVLMGWNPLYRRHEICDPGFLGEKRKPKPVKVIED